MSPRNLLLKLGIDINDELIYNKVVDEYKAIVKEYSKLISV